MKVHGILLIAALLISFCLPPGVSRAETSGGDPDQRALADRERKEKLGPWEFNLMLYWWLSGPTGKLTTADEVTHINASAFELFDLSDNAGALFFYASFVREKFGFFVDLAYGNLGVPIDPQKVELGPLAIGLEDLRFDTDHVTVEFAALYRFARWFRCEEEDRPRWKRPSLGLDAFTGFRYTHNDLRLNGNVVSTFTVGNAELWREEQVLAVQDLSDTIYPTIGLRIVAVPVDKFSILLQGDIGGFGAGVDLALHTIASVAYTFRVTGNWYMGIIAGYRALNEQSTSGEGPDRTEIDLTLHGPWFGLGFHY
jgi:hypothetical protein